MLVFRLLFISFSVPTIFNDILVYLVAWDALRFSLQWSLL